MSLINPVKTISAPNSWLILALILSISTLPLQADEIQPEDAKLVVASSLFEVVGESGVFGVVVAMVETKATFKPCYGPTFDIDSSRLKPTRFTCNDAPTPDPNPLNVSCNDVDKMWDTAAAQVVAEAKDLPLGTVYYGTSTDLMSGMVSAEVIAKTMDSVAQFKNCGKWMVGFGDKGTPLIHVVPASAMAMKEMSPK